MAIKNTKNCNDLEELKEKYNKFKEKYELPNFTELNEQFDIEEINPETEFLLKKIRRLIAEKIDGNLRFLEIILNPNNTPLFLFKLIKKLDRDEKEILNKLYEKLGNLEIELVSLDIEYNEKKEAEFIKKCFETFGREIRADLLKIIEKMKNNENSFRQSNGSYFG